MRTHQVQLTERGAFNDHSTISFPSPPHAPKPMRRNCSKGACILPAELLKYKRAHALGCPRPGECKRRTKRSKLWRNTTISSWGRGCSAACSPTKQIRRGRSASSSNEGRTSAATPAPSGWRASTSIATAHTSSIRATSASGTMSTALSASTTSSIRPSHATGTSFTTYPST